MDIWILWFLLLESVLQYPQPVGDGMDEVTRLHMEARAKFQEEERIRLEREIEQLALQQEMEQLALQQEIEQMVLQQGVWAWRHLPWSVLQHWQVWALAGLLCLLLALWFIWRKRSLRREEQEEENDGANEEEGRNVDANGEDGGNEREEGENDVNGEENNNDDGNAQEVDNVAANAEGGVGNEVGNEAGNAANNNNAANQADNHDPDDDIGRMVMERIQWPVQNLQRGCRWTNVLMNNFAFYFRRVLAGSFYPVLKPAIGVGSAFEGWSPREQDVVYQVLIPMTPPRGHSFRLQLDTEGQRHERNFRIRVQQECTCAREQHGSNMLCFLHHTKEELSNQDPSLLDTLCTDSYLDVQKTARWFCQLVRAIWPGVPQAHNWHFVLLPSRRCCQFKVSNGRESFRIEMLFGVRQGNSDVFVSSQPRHYYTSSTIWPETYAVAELKFLNYVAWRAPPDSLHLKCLQFFTHLQLGLGFSTYTTKTIVLHLLNCFPLSWWCRKHFVRRLLDISENLRKCIERRCLNHFIVGNQRLPEGIILPQHVLMSPKYNLFHDLVMDPAAHSQAMSQYVDLHQWLQRIINNEP